MRTMTKAEERQARRLLLAATLAKRGQANAWDAARDAARLRVLAKRLDTYNTNLCNREVSERERKISFGAVNTASDIAEKYGATAYFGGDPMGAAIRIYWPDMIPGKDPGNYTSAMLPVEID
ncbi:MAG: hypothetical protein ACK5R5_06000 [Alphaproteobacteria bacterium]|jgi:hypothetical protein